MTPISRTGRTGDDTAATAPEPDPEPAARWAWLWLWSRVVLLPVVVLLPLLHLPLVADHRFNIFRYGGDLTRNPWEIIAAPISSVPNYLGHGNFRPLARMVEQGQDFLALSLSRVTDLPVPMALRVVALVFAVLVCVAAVLWAETLSREGPALSGRPSALALLTALTFPMFLVASTGSAVVLYTSLYACSVAVVLLVASWTSRRAGFDSRRAGPVLLVAAVLIGAAMAAFNEITYLAVPLAVVTVAARGLLTLRMRLVDVLVSRAARVVLAAAVGFAAVLVPVRLLIAERCADGGCYAASDLSVTEAALPALGHRLLSAVPPVPWLAAEPSPQRWVPQTDPVLLGSLGALAVLVLLTAWEVRTRHLPPWRVVLVVVLAGLALLVGSSLAMALTTEVQNRVAGGEWPVGRGWRDLWLVAAAGSVVVAGVGCLLARIAGGPHRRAGRLVMMALVVLLGTGSSVTLGVNEAQDAHERAGSEGDLFDRISVALADHDTGTDAQRCALLAEFATIHPQRLDWQERLDTALESASQAWHQAPFCSGDHD
ncbi:hypothetical protein [Ornithinimicrobium cavernae]|uniref:hypothetical protein n=1 Tax=Ornithinimicrobium cavernae TaxID=2666047 RepID=UPI000D6984EE|nr:hypothetical protein [Ornithinimicrobium cavernae]